MGVSIGHRPGRETTRAHLETIAGGDGALKIRREVVAWNPGATDEQVEDAFQEACARAERACRGQVEAEVYTWLRTTTHRCLGRMRERREREPIADQPFDDLDPNELCAPGADVVVLGQERHAEVADAAKGVLERLSARQRDVAALHSHGFRRREIAERTRMSQRAVKRLMEQVLAIGRAELAELAGHGCDDGHDQVARYAFGLAGAREARRAQLHLATCERCGAMYARLDVWREKVAALLPVPPAVDAQTDVVERAVQAGTDLVSGTPVHAVDAPAGVRRHATELFAQLRDHAASAYYRTVDPTPLAGARPGAVAAAVAGCIALGGGATYCVQQGTGPFAGLAGVPAPERHDKPRPKRKRARAAQAPPVVAPPVTPPTTVQQQPPPPPPTTTQAAPPPAPEDEWEPGSVSAAAVKPEPAPAPADGPGEFDGP